MNEFQTYSNVWNIYKEHSQGQIVIGLTLIQSFKITSMEKRVQ